MYNLEKLQEGGFGQGILGGKGEFDVLKNLNYFPTFPFLWLDLTAAIDMVFNVSCEDGSKYLLLTMRRMRSR